MGGDAKLGLIKAYDSIQYGPKSADSSDTSETYTPWEYEQEACILRRALLKLSCDAVVDPMRASETARRAIACLPKESVFVAAEECRTKLISAAQLADQLMADKITT